MSVPCGIATIGIDVANRVATIAELTSGGAVAPACIAVAIAGAARVRVDWNAGGEFGRVAGGVVGGRGGQNPGGGEGTDRGDGDVEVVIAGRTGDDIEEAEVVSAFPITGGVADVIAEQFNVIRGKRQAVERADDIQRTDRVAAGRHKHREVLKVVGPQIRVAKVVGGDAVG